jgi:hypothetical protein
MTQPKPGNSGGPVVAPGQRPGLRRVVKKNPSAADSNEIHAAKIFLTNNKLLPSSCAHELRERSQAI